MYITPVLTSFHYHVICMELENVSQEHGCSQFSIFITTTQPHISFSKLYDKTSSDGPTDKGGQN